MHLPPLALRHLSFLLLSGCLAGCQGSYLRNRGRDAADMFTTTVGVGVAAHARVGILTAGHLAASDVAGLRFGEFFRHHPDLSDGAAPEATDNWTACVLSHILLIPLVANEASFSVQDRFPCSDVQIARGKTPASLALADWFRLEVTAGAGGVLRLGVNPAEILDFVLGWATLDLLGDDLDGFAPGAPPLPDDPSNP